MDVPKLKVETDAKGRKIINGEYTVVRKIGEGQYGKVMLAQTSSGKQVAIKTINRIDRSRLITKNYLSHAMKIKREIQIMKECDHTNVVKLYSVIDDLKFDKILLVLEYCAYGEIDWKNYNHYNEKYYKDSGITINRILRDVINGLDYLHRVKKIIHRDLKPSNLLIAMDKTIKISDFGVSLILENNINDDKELGNSVGTPAFFAPELCQFVNMRYSMLDLHGNLNEDKKNDKGFPKIKISYQIDLWSLGVILYCLIFHCLPFNGRNEFSLFKSIVDDTLTFPKLRHSTLATKQDMEELKDLKNLIIGLLNKDPSKRLTISDVMNHPFTCYDLDPTEKADFLHFNDKFKNEKSLLFKKSDRFKNMFKTAKPKPDLGNDSTTLDANYVNFKDLEPVDDLLDSYFDDSSSFGSVEEVHDRYEQATLHILENKDPTDIILQQSSPISESSDPPSPPVHFIESNILNSAGPSSSTLVPPKLSLDTSTSIDKPISPKIGYTCATATSSNPAKNVVTIGAGSPTLFNNMFSPSKRFFSKLKNKEDDQSSSTKQKPTINSLSKNEEACGVDEFDIFKPPNLFTPNSSRKNSITSIKSGGGLSRLTSSSSSLNLNGYLTDDNFSLASYRNSQSDSLKYKIDKKDEDFTNRWDHYDDDDDDDENDSAYDNEADITITDEPRRSNMSDYLDSLK